LRTEGGAFRAEYSYQGGGLENLTLSDVAKLGIPASTLYHTIEALKIDKKKFKFR